MRENIGIYRGKRADTGEWKEGYLHGVQDRITGLDLFFIVDENNESHKVSPETIGEYTGLTDKNGVKIFEGDIVSYFGKDFLNSLVTFDKGSFWFEFLSEYTRKIRDQKRDLIFSNVSLCGEIIGNIHDSPELLGGDDHAAD